MMDCLEYTYLFLFDMSTDELLKVFERIEPATFHYVRGYDPDGRSQPDRQHLKSKSRVLMRW